jgi:hypothetical protein
MNISGFQEIQARTTIAKVKKDNFGMTAELFGQMDVGDTL